MSESSKLLAWGDIFAATAMPVERVEVPEWGGHVFVRTITAGERDTFEAEMAEVDSRGKLKKKNADLVRGKLAALYLCDANGKRLCRDDDAGELSRRSLPAISRIVEAGNRLNGLAGEGSEGNPPGSDQTGDSHSG